MADTPTLQIRFTSGPLHGKLIEIDAFPYTLGRELDNDLILADDRVSRYHATLEFSNGSFYLSDNDSHNGCQYQQQNISRLSLEPGMEIQIGFSILKIELLEV